MNKYFSSTRVKAKVYLLVFSLFACASIGIHISAKAQSLQDLATIQVDQLTDAQVRQLFSQAQASGIAEQQLYTLAQQRGMPPSEVAKLQRRISQLRLTSQPLPVTGQVPEGRLRQTSQEKGQDIFETITSRDSLDRGLTGFEQKVFGYSTFHNKNLSFSPNFNMATPQNYVVGPGDQLIIQIYGVAQDNFTPTISPEGKINIPNIGLVHVGGFSIDAVKSLLKDQLAKRFSGLKGPQPNTFLSVTIGNIRTIKVNIVGELRNPGTYTLPSFATVYNALYAAGGPTTQGTFRNIQVYRAGKMAAEVDVYQFLTRGEQSTNIMMEDNDVILVRPIEKRVEMIGEVRIPGFYEVKTGESFQDLLYYAGGFTEKAYVRSVSVRRNSETQRRVETVEQGNYDSFEPRDGDVYAIGEIQDRFSNRVQISGAVVRPGEYELTEGMTVRQLIEAAGGLQGDAFLARSTLYRSSEDFTLQAQTVDLKAVMENASPDIPLRNEDILSIPSRYDVQEEFYVQISGEVNRVGTFPYAENLTVGDLILRAGGFKESASSAAIEIARRVKNDQSGKIAEIIRVTIPKSLELTPEDQNIKLDPFDHVFVRRSPGYREQKLVTIEGEVNYPGTYALESATMRISDLMRRAGGLNQFAYPKGATLIRRTEFYEERSEEELVAESLRKLQQSTKRNDVDNPAPEKLLLERIDVKLKEAEERQLSEEGEEQLESSEFRLDLLAEISQTDESQIKDTELVGIDLERILAEPGSKYDLILQEGDVITVPKELQTVRLRGEVLYPTTTRYDGSRGFRSYISSAGGFSDEAGRKKSYVIYANGNVKRTKSFLWIRDYPPVEPGAEIVVPVAPPKVSVQQSLNQIIGVTTSLLTLYFILNNTIPRE